MLKLPFYVVSDTHFYHDNIVRYCSRPNDHEPIMVKRWRQAIKDHDVVLHLGDLFMGGWEAYYRFKDEIAPRLTGQKYLILGNHDKKRYDYAALGFTVIKPFAVQFRQYEVSFGHYPKFINGNGGRVIHCHGHIHSHGYGHDGETYRKGNINCSVENLDYRPHRVVRLINREIVRLRDKPRYRNNNGRKSRYKKTP